MSILGIIPARYASSRFPGKPLVHIKGRSMLSRVYSQVLKAKKIDEILVATDDQRIADHADQIGAKVVMTSADHLSGTDRCLEALKKSGGTYDHVINIQGDEPFIDPDQVDSLAAACDSETEIATQMIACNSYETLFDPAEVKIVLNSRGEAMYFSRSVIPFLRNRPAEEWHRHFRYYRHVGLYAYRTDVLEKIGALEPSAVEQAESLEQLRWLQHGYRIKCVETPFDSYCIDSPADIEKVLRIMNIRD